MRVLLFVGWIAALPAVAADEAGFDVFEYSVRGNSVLPVISIETAVYPHLGEKKTIADVEAARTALEKAYHDAGYLTVLVDIPEQKVTSGVVTLRVTEGSVERLRVTGSRYFSLGEIRATAPELAEGSVPHFPTMQKELVALNTSEDRRVTPVLRPAKTPGQVEVDLKVQDQFPLHGEMTLDNRASANTTETRLSGNLRYSNLWQKQHSLGIGFQVAPQEPDEARVLSLTYLQPAMGGMLALYGIVSRSDVGVAGDTRVLGNANIAGARWIKPLRTWRGANQLLSLGVDYKDFSDDLLFGADTYTTPISYMPFSVEYRGSVNGEYTKTQWNLGFTFSLRGLADETIECVPGFFTNEFDCKRFGAKPDFAYLRGGFRHERSLGKDYSLAARFEFQLANQPLISNEQYSAGGAQTVRGYTESAALGDRGVIAGLEAIGPEWGESGRFGLRPLAFAEGATLKVIEATTLQEDEFNLASVGLGLRLSSRLGLSSDLDVAWPLRALGESEKHELRLHWRLSYKW
ncbi:MAG: BamA/TamA family outer membrane protein [Thiobacillus sp.]|nr:BamA/TamA family outer membrane protein [Thiobacillus sp.]